jgi:hypothetical protein
MKSVLRFVMVCLAGGMLLACSSRRIDPSVKSLLTTGEDAFRHVPIGLCEDYPEESTTRDIFRSDFELLKRTGVDLLRISFGWDAIEAEKDKMTWLFWDEYVKTAVEEYGITLIPYVCYTPRWNSSGAGDNAYYWDYPPVDFEEFGQFMKALVGRYKKWIHSWEIWNEPDISIYWRGTAEEFSRLVKIGSQAVREADPNALVVLGGIAYNPAFIQELFRDHGVSPFVDVVNIHNYYETWSPNPVERIRDYIQEVRDVVNRYGNRQPMWMAEVGYSTFRQGGHVSSEYNATYEYEHTPAYQAVDLVRRLSLVLSTGMCSAIAWYEIKDLPPSDEVIGDEYNNRYLGIARIDHSPKPAEKSLVHFKRLFSQKYRSLDKRLRIERSADSDSEIHGFENEDKTVILVGWLKTHVPDRKAADAEGDARDMRQETVRVVFPGTRADKAVVGDEFGNEAPWTGCRVQGDSVSVEGWLLTGGMVSVLRILQ